MTRSACLHRSHMKHLRSPRSPGLPLWLAALVASSGCAAPRAKPQAAATPKKPVPAATHTVARGTLKRSVQLDAVFEAAEMHPLRIEPKAWMDWTVLEAVAHGARPC